MSEIRRMTVADLGAVNALLVRAFSQSRKEEGLQPSEQPLCCSQFLRLYLEDTPEFCLVLIENQRLCAAVFTHQWGQVGWLGPVAVLPEWQGKGLGKKIVRASLDLLRDAGCLSIGLEVHPQNLKNINFYSRLDFLPGPVTIDVALSKSAMFRHLSKSRTQRPLSHGRVIADCRILTRDVERLTFSLCSSEEKDDFLQNNLDFVKQIDGSVDYRRLIMNVAHHRYGESFLFSRNREPFAYITVQTGAVAVGERTNVGRILTFVANSKITPFQVIALLTNLMEITNVTYLIVRIPAFHGHLLPQFLQNHFRVIHSTLRMFLAGHEGRIPDRGLHLNKWE